MKSFNADPKNIESLDLTQKVNVLRLWRGKLFAKLLIAISNQ